MRLNSSVRNFAPTSSLNLALKRVARSFLRRSSPDESNCCSIRAPFLSPFLFLRLLRFPRSPVSPESKGARNDGCLQSHKASETVFSHCTPNFAHVLYDSGGNHRSLLLCSLVKQENEESAEA